MGDILRELYEIAEMRRAEKKDGSYTCYLFEQGTDKILKKCGEECAETIIAVKNGVKTDTVGEINDLLYHLAVLMANEGISIEDVYQEHVRRNEKELNLKKFHSVDKNS